MSLHQPKKKKYSYPRTTLYSSLTGGGCYKVMLQSGKYDLVHKYFDKMRKMGEATKALTYKGNFFSF